MQALGRGWSAMQRAGHDALDRPLFLCESQWLEVVDPVHRYGVLLRRV